MSFAESLADPMIRAAVAADAVSEAQNAVRERPGLRGIGAQVGFETIQRLRPGFLEHHVHNLLPDMAGALAPHWQAGTAAGDPCTHLEEHADDVSQALLLVTDDYVAQASDTKAVAVYQQLRARAPTRIAEQMPRIAKFVERHSPGEATS